MAIKITDQCIVCNACLPECPNTAIYEPGIEWVLGEGNNLKGIVPLSNGEAIDAGARNYPISNEFYYIVPDKCTECQGFHEEPQCASVCPVDACVPDELYNETVEELAGKHEKMHSYFK